MGVYFDKELKLTCRVSKYPNKFVHLRNGHLFIRPDYHFADHVWLKINKSSAIRIGESHDSRKIEPYETVYEVSLLPDNYDKKSTILPE